MKRHLIVFLCATAGCAHDKPNPEGAAAAPTTATPATTARCAQVHAGGAPSGKYNLVLHLAPGEVRRYATEVDVHTKVTANDAPMFDQPMKIKVVHVLEVGAAGTDGTAELKQRFENFDVAAEGPAAEMMKQMASSMTKVAIISSLCPDGTVLSSKTEGSDSPMVEGMARQMGQGSRFTFLPKTPVGPGDTWTTQEETPLGMGGGGQTKSIIKSKLKFVGVESCGAKQCAHIESESESSTPEGGELSGGGKGHSTLLIELDTGRPQNTKGSQEARYQGSQQGQQLDITSKVSYSSVLK